MTNIKEFQGANMDIDLVSENIGWNQVSCPWNEAENTTVHKCAVKTSPFVSFLRCQVSGQRSLQLSV